MNWVKVIEQNALSEGARQIVKVGKRSILLLQYQGQTYAVDSSCPHMKISMKNGKIRDDGAIVCPLHRSAFDLHSGEVKEWTPFPPGIGKVLGMISKEKPLPVFPIRIEEGSILIGIEE